MTTTSPATPALPDSGGHPQTVLCGRGCGYLATSEPDLNDHETHCDHHRDHDSEEEVTP